MDKITKTEIETIIAKELAARGITSQTTSSMANVINEIELSDLSESTKKTLAEMLTKAETLDKSIRRNSVVATSPGQASAEIDRLAKEFITKSSKPIDLAMARVEVRKLHPELAQQERDEYRHF